MPESQANRLILTQEATLDLDRLDLFLRPVSPAAADRFQDVIWEALKRLREHPRFGRRWSSALKGDEIREVVVPFGRSAYVVRYRLRANESSLRASITREDRSGG